jgi:streptogramin lyase
MSVLVATAIFAGTASAKTIELLKYNGSYPAASFDGSGSVGGPAPFGYGQQDMSIFQETGQVFVGSYGSGRIYKFSAAGVAEPFSALAPATTIAQSLNTYGDVFVDNSSTATKGRIYAFPESGPVAAYEPDGNPAPNFPISVGGACGGDVAPDGSLWIASYSQNLAIQFNPETGEATGETVSMQRPCDLVIDSQGNFYMVQEGFGVVRKYDSTGTEVGIIDEETSGGEPELAVNLSNDHLFVDHRNYITEYDDSGALLGKFGKPEGSYPGLEYSRGVAVRASNNVVYATSENSPNRVDTFAPSGPIVVPDVTTGSAQPEGTSATLEGTVNADGVATTDCNFEWGPEGTFGFSYTKTTPCTEGNVFTGPEDHAVTAAIGGLTKGLTYHYRVSAENANGVAVFGKDRTIVAQGSPKVSGEFVSDVNTDGARIHAVVDPDHGISTFHVEYGTDTSYGSTAPIPDAPVVGQTSSLLNVSQEISGLLPGTEYHYKVVASNLAGSGESTADHTFKTFPFVPILDDICPNALARQQTGAALLLDCRAYELVSAPNAEGYDVESSLVPGQRPFEGHPRATDRLLYGVHNGGIPGSGSPTNNGIDPYIAKRGADGWVTKYVGIPADGTPSNTPFASPLLAADQNLENFAFGGSNLCQPCFADGTSGVPVRRADGTLVQGMSGQIQPGPSAGADGLIVAPMSADGKHLVFGSVLRFQSDGNDNTGDVSIYDRNLETGVTRVVSKTPAGTNLPCLQGAGSCHSPSGKDGIAELAMSSNGTRIVVAQKVAADSAGNDYWHPYMHIGASSDTVDLAPGTTTGVLFDGMTADGSRVFLTTRDKLLAADTDSSADIYEAKIDEGGTVTLRLISVESDGNPSNDDGCTPIQKWNVVSGGFDCSAVAFAGGSGVASGNGTFYFVSPEQLDGTKGMADQANLYVVRPDQSPQFVTIMDSSLEKPPPPPPDHPVINPSLIGGLAGPEALAVDLSNNDIYVKERNTSTVARFHSDGTPHNFTAGPNAGTNRITGENLGGTAEGQIAVDNHSGSPFENDFYVSTDSNSLSVFAQSGEKLGSIHTPYMGYVCGVAVDQSTGAVYVGDYYGTMHRLEPISNTTPVTSANYVATVMYPQFFSACQVAADSAENVYGSQWSNGPVKRWVASNFSDSPSSFPGTIVSAAGSALYADPFSNDVYVDIGDRINVHTSGGVLKEALAQGEISGSKGVAVNGSTHHVYVANGQSIVEIGYVVHPLEPIDAPAIRHGVRAAGVHDWSDFQVTPDGRYAAFASATSITGYNSSNHFEVFRYDDEEEETLCVSCAPTNARATGDATLAANGLSLSDDGRVFFTSTEPLVLRDSDSVKDAYEWSNGEIQLISAGSSLFPSALFSVSEDGKDAFFFTRDKLSNDDENGSVMKIYDAREGGGRFLVPEPPQCAASDECHGPGSQQPPKPGIASLAGSEGNLAGTETKPRKCHPGYVKRHGVCVRKHRQHRHGAHGKPNRRHNGNRNGNDG